MSAATTTGPDDLLALEGSCFLTAHASVLCFVGGEIAHRELHELPPPRDLLIAAAAPHRLRRAAAEFAPLDLRVRGPVGRGRVQVLGVRASGALATVNLQLGDEMLSAGSAGGVIVRSRSAGLWEEFLPIAPADLGRLLALVGRDWFSLADRSVRPAADNRLLPGFDVGVGPMRASLRDHEELAGVDPTALVLLAEGGTLERLVPFTPILLWRNDGREGADAEIAAGLRSLAHVGGFPGRVIVQTGLSAEALAAAHPDPVIALPPPADAERGLHDLSATLAAAGIDPGEGPVLCLANGVMFDAPAAAVVAAAATLAAPAAAPWLRTAWEAGDGGAPDPREGAGGQAVDAAILALPTAGRFLPHAAMLAALRRAHAAAELTDQAESARLRRVLATCTPHAVAGLQGHVAAAGPDAAERRLPGCGLLNLRSVPASLRSAVMLECLAASGAVTAAPESAAA